MRLTEPEQRMRDGDLGTRSHPPGWCGVPPSCTGPGTIPTRPASWKDLFFDVVHRLPGSW